ncbi:MAG: hypothetical protein R2844_15990 [Caldilineales bacterium]
MKARIVGRVSVVVFALLTVFSPLAPAALNAGSSGVLNGQCSEVVCG